MADFPTWGTQLKRPSRINGKVVKPQHRSESESGFVKTRAAGARAREVPVSLEWNLLPEAQFQVLKAHYAANVGLTFTVTDPETGAAFTMGYTPDGLTYSRDAKRPRKRRVTVVLEERHA